jgi:hypothetical protein
MREEEVSNCFQPLSNPLPRGVCSNPLIPPGSVGTPTPSRLAFGVRADPAIELASLKSKPRKSGDEP